MRPISQNMRSIAHAIGLRGLVSIKVGWGCDRHHRVCDRSQPCDRHQGWLRSVALRLFRRFIRTSMAISEQLADFRNYRKVSKLGLNDPKLIENDLKIIENTFRELDCWLVPPIREIEKSYEMETWIGRTPLGWILPTSRLSSNQIFNPWLTRFRVYGGD